MNRAIAQADTTPPRVTNVFPDNDTGPWPRDMGFWAVFSEPMDPSTITTGTVLLRVSGTNTNVLGTVNLVSGGLRAEFTPSSLLNPAFD